MFKVADNLILPASAPTDTFALLGTRGSGKTYAAGRIVEAFHDGGVQVVIVDPVGVWWGLRLAADGRGPGLSIPVFGGWHGDVPLEPTSGSLCAQLVAERGISVVLDVSEFPSEAAQRRFVTDFARDLFDLKKRNRSPVHVVFEEAHEFLPQQVDAGAAQMVGAVKRMWKLGRNFGIGGSLVSQRAAEVNKGALNLTQTLITGKLKGPQDRKAIAGWASDQDRDEGPLKSLPTLGNGRLIAWLETGAREVRFLPKRTFDASKTPEAGERAAAQALPAIDIGEVRSAMAATIEEAKANDPKALRAEVARLRAESARGAVDGIDPVAHRNELVAAFEDGARREREKFDGLAPEYARHLRTVGHAVHRLFEDLGPALAALKAPVRVDGENHVEIFARERVASAITSAPPREVPSKMPPRAPATAADPGITLGDRRALTVLAQFPAGVTRRKLGTISGYAPSGSSMRAILAHLRATAFVEDLPDGGIKATRAGITALGPWKPLPTGRALLDFWMAELPEGPRKVLEALAGFFPNGMTKDGIARETTYEAGGSSMRAALAKLRALELVEDRGGAVFASPDLFDRRAA